MSKKRAKAILLINSCLLAALILLAIKLDSPLYRDDKPFYLQPIAVIGLGVFLFAWSLYGVFGARSVVALLIVLVVILYDGYYIAFIIELTVAACPDEIMQYILFLSVLTVTLGGLLFIGRLIGFFDGKSDGSKATVPAVAFGMILITFVSCGCGFFGSRICYWG